MDVIIRFKHLPGEVVAFAEDNILNIDARAYNKLSMRERHQLLSHEIGHWVYMNPQPVSPQTEGQQAAKQSGPFIPTLDDLHKLFSEEEERLEQQAKCVHNWMYTGNTSNGCGWQCTKCSVVTEDSRVVAGLKPL